ncbi:hypothetical protein RJ55_03159 [Drechmeria coniospora]|nr:hypothetical protein RJ55_03159 [Drechmeria coniospora]
MQPSSLSRTASGKENPQPPQQGHLPKSKTMNEVLHGLKSSFSRTNLTRRMPAPSASMRSQTPSQHQRFKAPQDPAFSPSTQDTETSQSASHVLLPWRSSLDSPSDQSLPGQARPSTEPRPNSAASTHRSTRTERLSQFIQEFTPITVALPSQEWTGRFSTLDSEYRSQGIDDKLLVCLKAGLSAQKRFDLKLRDIRTEDARNLAVFAQLEMLCVTNEAKQSLQEFQDTFARRFRRSILRPGRADFQARRLVESFPPSSKGSSSASPSVMHSSRPTSTASENLS